MREAICKAGPFMHFPQEVGNLDQRKRVADLGIQFVGRRRNLASSWCNDQRPGFKTNTFELSGPCSVRQTLQVEVEHLMRFGKPLRAVTLDGQSKAILLLHGGECRPGHKMLVDRPEGSAAIDPNVSRSKPVSQSRERCNLVESTIRSPLAEDEPPISLAKVGDRHTIRECPPLLGIEPFQQRNRRKKRIVAAR